MSTPTGPTRMPRPDHTSQVDSHLNVIYKQWLFFFSRKIRTEQQGRKTRHSPIFQTILRHVLDWLLKPKKTSSDPGALSKSYILSYSRQALCTRRTGKQLALKISSQIDFLIPITKGRAERVRGLRCTNTCQDGCGADRTAVVHTTFDVVAQLPMQNQAFSHADR